MRIKICSDCGKEFQAAKTWNYLCSDCAKAAKAATIIRDRICRQCGATFPGGPRAWYCPQCRLERKRERDRRFKQQTRAAGGVKRPLGSTDICLRCGAQYVVQGGRQQYCKNCAPEAVREKVNQHKAQYAREHKAEYAARKQGSVKICVVCGKPFTNRGPSVTCSDKCAQKRRNMWQATADNKRGKRKQTN